MAGGSMENVSFMLVMIRNFIFPSFRLSMFGATNVRDILLPLVANVKPKFETSLLVYRFFIYLTPFIPLSFKGEGELVLKEGAPAPS
jgi:hypothetical protein